MMWVTNWEHLGSEDIVQGLFCCNVLKTCNNENGKTKNVFNFIYYYFSQHFMQPLLIEKVLLQIFSIKN